MAQILHARATTTARIRKEIQESKKSIRELAAEYNINFKTVLKWKHRDSVNDNSCHNKKVRTVLSDLEQQAICIFRKSTNLPLDDCYIALKETIPNLSRSNLHRCLKRHGLSILPPEFTKSLPAKPKQKFKTYEIGYFHIDITEINLGKNNKFYLFVAIDRTSKFAIAKLYQKQTIENSNHFLNEVIKLCPYKIHTILTDNGAQFTYNLLDKNYRPKGKSHSFDIICKKNFIRHKTTQFRHPWTNGQVERFNGSLKEATTKKYHYDGFEHLEKHLQEFLLAYNFAKKLKSINYKTPMEFLSEKYKEIPKVFNVKPCHYAGGFDT